MVVTGWNKIEWETLVPLRKARAWIESYERCDESNIPAIVQEHFRGLIKEAQESMNIIASENLKSFQKVIEEYPDNLVEKISTYKIKLDNFLPQKIEQPNSINCMCDDYNIAVDRADFVLSFYCKLKYFFHSYGQPGSSGLAQITSTSTTGENTIYVGTYNACSSVITLDTNTLQRLNLQSAG